jgi:hypothetical protein
VHQKKPCSKSLLDAEHGILQNFRLKDGAAEKALEAEALTLALGNSQRNN